MITYHYDSFLTMMIADDFEIAFFEVTEWWNYNKLFSLDNLYFTINYRLSYMELIIYKLWHYNIKSYPDAFQKKTHGLSNSIIVDSN